MSSPSKRKSMRSKVPNRDGDGRRRKCPKAAVKTQAHPDLASSEAHDFSECPVCFEVFTSPIYQCPNGHLICHICFHRFDNCPTCNDDLTGEIRNLAIEKLLRDALYDCPNLDKGCFVRSKLDQLDDHVQTLCRFEMKNYCSKLSLNCVIKANLADLGNHLSCAHQISGCVNSQLLLHQSIPYGEALQAATTLQWKPHFVTMDGNMFILTTHGDLNEKSVSWMVNVMGTSAVASQYAYKIQLFPRNCQDEEKNSFTEYQGQVHPFSTQFSSSLMLLSAPFRHLALLGKREAVGSIGLVIRYHLGIAILKKNDGKSGVVVPAVAQAPILSDPTLIIEKAFSKRRTRKINY